MRTPDAPSRRDTRPFEAVLLLGLALGGFGLIAAFLLCQRVLIPLASACLQACASDPMLMQIARAGAGLTVATVASGLAAGTAVLIEQLRSTFRLIRQVESRVGRVPPGLARLASELGIRGRLTYVLDPAPYAFCYGFLSPRICVSSGMARTLTHRELRAVLLHESVHLRQLDPLKVLLSRSVAGALFLLPAAAQLRDRYLLAKELSADAEVADRLSPRPLAGAILKIYRSASRRPVADLAAAAVGPFDMIGERIRHLSRPTVRLAPLGRWSAALSLGVAAAILFATVGSGYAAERSQPVGGSCCGSGSVCDLPGGTVEAP
ncbi:MAG: M56 family metallopeptidase [Sphingomonadaceae bacterium]